MNYFSIPGRFYYINARGARILHGSVCGGYENPLSGNFFCRGKEQSKIFCLYLQPRKDDNQLSRRGRKEGFSSFRGDYGEMPEWSIGPHSKCGVRVTVPGVRIPLSPQRINRSEGWFFFLIWGKVQEWLNWPAWKASKPLKGFRGSNPLLSASRRCREKP